MRPGAETTISFLIINAQDGAEQFWNVYDVKEQQRNVIVIKEKATNLGSKIVIDIK